MSNSPSPHEEHFRLYVSRKLRALIGGDVRRREEIAQKSGRSLPCIRRAENAESTITLYTAYLLAEALGIGIEELTRGFDEWYGENYDHL